MESNLNRKVLVRDSVKTVLVHSSESEAQPTNAATLSTWIAGRKSKGYADSGFHFIIFPDGTFNEPSSIWLAGAHTARYNDIAVGILIISEKGKSPTTEQLNALIRIYDICRMAYPKAELKGVGELTGGKNPYFNVKDVL